MKFRRENGVISIETTVCLSLFLFAFMSIISLAKIAKVESMTQYAIDQVAKEMSKYYYIASKVGLARNSGQTAGDLDQTVSSIFDFADRPYEARAIVFGKHCYACTAGAGSSCGGATE